MEKLSSAPRRLFTRPALFLLAVSTLLVNCGQSSSTGIYSAKSGNAIVMVDLVQSENGTLTGRLEAIDAKPDGTLDNTEANLTGVRDGEAISLSLRGSSILSGTKQVSARLAGEKLTVALVANEEPLVLLKSDMATFLKDGAALRARASKLGQENQLRELKAKQDRAIQDAQSAEAERIADQQRRLANDLRELNTAIDEMRPRAARVAKRAELVSAGYDRATAEMARLLTRQRSTVGQERYEVQRSQLRVAISQQAVQSESVHNEVESGTRDIMGTLDRIEEGLTEVTSRCALPASVARSDIAQECQTLSRRAPAHRAIATRLRAQLSGLETQYRSIAQRQAEIQRASEAMD